ncbi:MAG: LptF/LptG family permease, partial [Syntrophobacteraceae bacterium]
VSFKNYDFILSIDDIMGAAGKAARNISEMNLAEIYHQIKSVVDTTDFAKWRIELHQRIAFPSACLLLGLLGPPLGSLFRQKSRITGITVAIGIFLVYYILLSAGRVLGETRVLPPFFAVWTPNLLSFVLVVYLWAKMHRETPFQIAILGRRLVHLVRRGSGARTHVAAAR